MATPFGVLTTAWSGSVNGAADTLPIWQSSTNSAFNITRNQLLAITGNPVGDSDSQTLTNKTLTAPTISSPVLSGTITGTYTIGGTPTFPSSVVTLSASQTLTNKTLTSPTINSPSITNATITADTLSGYTTSNTGTVYGMSVTTGLLASAAIAGKVNFAALTSSIFGGQVTSASNGGTAGGTIYYVNLGGLKLAWGLTGSVDSSTSPTAVTIVIPNSFFTTIQGAVVTATPSSGASQFANIGSVSGNTISVYPVITASTATQTIWFFVIGD